MKHKHLKNILLKNDVLPRSFSEMKLALKLVMQKEKFILEDAVRALHYNKNIHKIDGKYTIYQYINQIENITNQYYHLYIKISQFEAFLRTYINHKMIKIYGEKWHTLSIVKDIREFQKLDFYRFNKPSKALNSVSFGTLELIFLNGSRFTNVFQKTLHYKKILTKDNKIKYGNKYLIKNLFSIVRNARNDICHHRRIGESIKQHPKYRKKKMTKSEVIQSLHDLKLLLGYDDCFDLQSIELKYKEYRYE